jgi:predicted molibdopterin-dependent oxidoreductase YjgC
MDYVNDTSVLDLTAEDVKDPLLVEQPVEDINQYKQFVARLLELQEKNLEIQNVHAEENLRMLEMIREKDTYILQYGIEIPQNRKCLSVDLVSEIRNVRLEIGYYGRAWQPAPTQRF